MIAQEMCFDCLQRQIKNFSTLMPTHNLQPLQECVEKNLSLLKQSYITPNKQDNLLTPPQIAIDIYKDLSTTLQNDDPYTHIKQESIQKAFHICQELISHYPAPKLEPTIQNDTIMWNKDSVFTRLDWAVRMAILGNVIDYGSQHSFSFDNADFDFKSLHFGVYDLKPFISKLESAKSLLYIADNAGENIFDTLLIATLKAIYPHLSISYAVRGRAIINDLTLQDMLHPLAQPLLESCEVLSSGVRSPGFVYADANPQTQSLYNSADMILAKGMGNFECLESYKDERLFLLFKIKCDVVAKFCNKAKGTMMFLHNTHYMKE